jgi:hypothetical protein
VGCPARSSARPWSGTSGPPARRSVSRAPETTSSPPIHSSTIPAPVSEKRWSPSRAGVSGPVHRADQGGVTQSGGVCTSSVGSTPRCAGSPVGASPLQYSARRPSPSPSGGGQHVRGHPRETDVAVRALREAHGDAVAGSALAHAVERRHDAPARQGDGARPFDHVDRVRADDRDRPQVLTDSGNRPSRFVSSTMPSPASSCSSRTPSRSRPRAERREPPRVAANRRGVRYGADVSAHLPYRAGAAARGVPPVLGGTR